jgi:hypothetical protein
MQSITVSRAFLLCLTALALFPCLCRADDSNSKNGKPGQFTNGQNGTPNLPLAPAMIVDKNNMRRALNYLPSYAEAITQKQNTFLPQLYQKAQTVVNDLAKSPTKLETDYASLQDLIIKAHTGAQMDAMRIQLPNQYLYAGTEVRAGSDKPIFGPEVTIGDTRSGLEFGLGGYFQSAETEGMRRHDSLGLSLKYIPQSLAAHTAQETEKILQRINGLEYSPTDSSHRVSLIQLLYEAVNSHTSRIDKIRTVSRLLSILLPSSIPDVNGPTSKITILQISQALGFDATALNGSTAESFHDFVENIRRPAVALVVGEQLFNGGGDAWNTGITASQLYPFGHHGQPGVTALAATQYFHVNLSDFRRDGVRMGLAFIYQDSTLYLRTPTELSQPWNYKIGVEYTSPVLGLHDTKAVFVRYRDPHSYAEITVTYGEDGLGKNYGDVNIGKTITF